MKRKISTLGFILISLALLATGCRKTEKHSDPLTDVEGNTYKTVIIGSQVWMAENLKTTTFSDGTNIPLTIDATSWGNLTTPGYCWYNNDAASYKDSYGALYNCYTVSTGKLCPTGWHVPEKEEWQELRQFLGDSLQAGGKLKETGIVNWLSPNKGADNSSGFTALGAGFRYFEGTFASILSFTSFWSSTTTSNDDEWYTGLYFADASFTIDHRNKKHGFSVRCLKN
jgi:Fibrobacter succinogenes major domain (Fib_succ_major).